MRWMGLSLVLLIAACDDDEEWVCASGAHPTELDCGGCSEDRHCKPGLLCDPIAQVCVRPAVAVDAAVRDAS